MTLDVQIIPILKDNYAYLIQSGDVTAIIDPGETAPIIDVLDNQGLSLDYILNTHHHGDHVAGNKALLKRYGAKLVAPAKEVSKIRGVDIELSERDVFEFGDTQAHILETSGHTLGGICIYFEEDKVLFSGDTLFSLGCGRLFEGTAEDMFRSFEKLNALPDDTLVYPGHEYTQSNAAFCLHVDPENEALQARSQEIDDIRSRGVPTIPVSLGVEKVTNPFLKAKSADEFAALRTLKDKF